MTRAFPDLPSHAASWSGARVSWIACGATLLFAAIILAHAALLPGGRWDGDEYLLVAKLREHGIGYALRRLYGWSPRPFSEVTLWAYAGLVLATGRQLIIPFLAALWSVLVGAGILAFWSPRRDERWWRLVLASGVPALLLLVYSPKEMFFWPMAAAPYLLAMTGAVVLTFRLVAGRATTARERLVCGGALALAAGSSETGLFFALGFAITLALLDLAARWRQPARMLADGLWYLLPLALSGPLVVLLLVFRVPVATPQTPDPTYHFRLWPSLRATVHDLWRESMGAVPFVPGPSFGQFVAICALCFAGLWLCLQAAVLGRASRRHMLALAAGASASIFGSVAAAFYEYGMPCCQRHYAFRQGMLVLLLLALARLAGLLLPRPATWLARLLGPPLLLAAAGVLLATRLPALVHDVRLLGTDRLVSARNWALPRDPAVPLVFRLPPRGEVLTGLDWSPGHYANDESAPWFVRAMLQFYRHSQGDMIATPAPDP